MAGAKIVLVTASDDTFRKPLLETAGYNVRIEPTIAAARAALAAGQYDVVLIAHEGNLAEVQTFCRDLKSGGSKTRIALLARWTEEIPNPEQFDALIRGHQSPPSFLAIIRGLVSEKREL